MAVSVLVPSKTDEYIEALLQSMEAMEPGSSHCVVVGDNGLSEAMRGRWPAVTFIAVPRPFVFARAINLCAAAAPPESDLLVLNDDTQIETPGWLVRITEALAAGALDGYGLVSLQINGGVGNPDQLARDLRIYEVVESDKTICFVAALIPRRAWEIVGPLDERFVAYGWDDDDCCRRVRLAGLKCGVTGAATVKHGAGGHPHSSTYARLGADEHTRQFHVNRQIFIEKWGLSALSELG